MTHTTYAPDKAVSFITGQIPDPQLTESGGVKVGPWSWFDGTLPDAEYLEKTLEFCGAIYKAQQFVAKQKRLREEAEAAKKEAEEKEREYTAWRRATEAAKIYWVTRNETSWDTGPSSYQRKSIIESMLAVLKGVDEGLV